MCACSYHFVYLKSINVTPALVTLLYIPIPLQHPSPFLMGPFLFIYFIYLSPFTVDTFNLTFLSSFMRHIINSDGRNNEPRLGKRSKVLTLYALFEGMYVFFFLSDVLNDWFIQRLAKHCKRYSADPIPSY